MLRTPLGALAYTNLQHGGPSEHKGPADFNGGFNGGEEDEDEDGDATPPRGLEGSVEPQMMPPQYPGQPPFAHLRQHAPSASPPINAVPFTQRGHTPQPGSMSRPSSRGDIRRMGTGVPHPGVPPGHPQPTSTGYAFIPHPSVYNPQNQPNMPQNMQHGQYPYPPPHQQHASMQPYMEEHQRRVSMPQTLPPQGSPPNPPGQRHTPSPPQPRSQQLSPQPQRRHPEPPEQHQQSTQRQGQQPPPPPPEQPAPPAPMEPKAEQPAERPGQPFLDTASAIKKLPQRKQHSIFTPIDENRSILSQHLTLFDRAAGTNKEESGSDLAHPNVAPSSSSSPPAAPRRANTSSLAQPRGSVSSISDAAALTPPSRADSLRAGGAGPRPRLKVQIPDEASDAGSNTADSNHSPRNSSDTSSHNARRNVAEPHSTGPVLPPPSPSASALLSAGATGPPNPFARPPPHQNANVNMDTPASALPSRFMNNEFLPSPSSFYPEWNYRGNDSNTLPSPLNFATPVVGSGPSFLRDENAPGGNKRKSPEMATGASSSDVPEGVEAKRIRVDG